MMLLRGALGAALSLSLLSRLMARLGERKAVLFSGLGLLVVLTLIGFAATLPLLMAVLLLGIGAAAAPSA